MINFNFTENGHFRNCKYFFFDKVFFIRKQYLFVSKITCKVYQQYKYIFVT